MKKCEVRRLPRKKKMSILFELCFAVVYLLFTYICIWSYILHTYLSVHKNVVFVCSSWRSCKINSYRTRFKPATLTYSGFGVESSNSVLGRNSSDYRDRTLPLPELQPLQPTPTRPDRNRFLTTTFAFTFQTFSWLFSESFIVSLYFPFWSGHLIYLSLVFFW